MTRAVVLFDGSCAMCHGFVNFIIKFDKHNAFKFASLQAPVAHQLASKCHLKADLSSVVLVELQEGTHKQAIKGLTKSSAALRCFELLPQPWPLLGILRVVPQVIRDWVYDFIGSIRYRLFGYSSDEACVRISRARMVVNQTDLDQLGKK
eukprot:c3116_g1_i1.p1 GENE.c3116_g1_i1~~c3116_g1_i1.p1  ORF type:complete len:165 (-),score=41.46 c3116_g1_i1:366-815(-)